MKKIEIKKELVIYLVFLFMLMGASFYLGMLKEDVRTTINKVRAGTIKPAITDINTSMYMIEQIQEECKNLSFERAVNCVVMNTLPYYKYIDYNSSIEQSPSETLINGGICTEWSNYYKFIFTNLGYDCNKIITPSQTHMVLLVSTDDTYCIVDQNTYHCQRLGNE